MKKKPSRAAQEEARAGLSALQAGDFASAEQLLASAARIDRRDPAIRVNLGLAQQGIGEVDAAALSLSEALALAPKLTEAARALQGLASQYVLSQPLKLNSFGLKAALAFDQLDRQPLVELALAHAMAQPDLASALEECRRGQADRAATVLLGRRTAKALQNDVLLKALPLGKNTDPDVERLLSELRRFLLLEIPPARMSEDPPLFTFKLALAGQCLVNEHVWACGKDEQAALSAMAIEREKLLGGDLEEARKLALILLYRPVEQTILADIGADDATSIRPKALRDMLVRLLRARDEEHRLRQGLDVFGSISDSTSVRVAGQYEKAPYPRWTSLHASQPGSLRRALGRFFSQQRLAFMDQPFDVLIAGCGTGQQAARAASGYGDKASVLGIDLSRASLAYASGMADRFGIKNVSFKQGDILELAALGGKFDVIEAIGVLHHMADPFAGWQVLVDHLKPGGLIYIGLYSAIARADIQALRDHDEAWPGAGCCDDEARRYRARLMGREDGEAGAVLKKSQDFYSLSEFRDLVLHESEQQMTLGEIERFLDNSGLMFRGFTLPSQLMEHYFSHYPQDGFPGTLAHWAELEETHRSLFEGMYLFWCEKRPES